MRLPLHLQRQRSRPSPLSTQEFEKPALSCAHRRRQPPASTTSRDRARTHAQGAHTGSQLARVLSATLWKGGGSGNLKCELGRGVARAEVGVSGRGHECGGAGHEGGGGALGRSQPGSASDLAQVLSWSSCGALVFASALCIPSKVQGHLGCSPWTLPADNSGT